MFGEDIVVNGIVLGWEVLGRVILFLFKFKVNVDKDIDYNKKSLEMFEKYSS